MIGSRIFTDREMKVINKKMKNEKLTQVDSNYLTRFIRPKLKEMVSIDSKFLLDKMEYNQKIKSMEGRIRKVVLGCMKDVQAIVIYGSAIQTNYKDYNDVDILVVIKNKISLKEKYIKIIEIKKRLSKYQIKSDFEIYDWKTIKKSYSHSPSLIYQLKDKKIIYGKLELKNKIELYNIDLKMKLDWSNLEDNPEGIEIYKALRNVILVRLLLNKIIDNGKLKESLNEEIGKNLLGRLKNNQESKADRKIALIYLKNLLNQTEKEIGEELWEKIESKSPCCLGVGLLDAQELKSESNKILDIIKILGNILGNVVVHKILVKYTNKPESVHHLAEEIGTYRDNALEMVPEFNWNKDDKEEIKQETLRNFSKRIKKYGDVKFPVSEVNKLIEETINECFI